MDMEKGGTEILCIFKIDYFLSKANSTSGYTTLVPSTAHQIHFELCIVISTSNYRLWTLYRFYFYAISADIEFQVYGMTCC
jgi:hypothetical protein